MGKDYFVADTHFGDERIIGYENRPFKTAEEMDEELIKRWNCIVTQDDTVYHLGDFSYYDADKNQEILKRLNGEKILVMGNHDIKFTPYEWREMGFNECISFPIVYKNFFMLSHEPMYINTNMPYANFFGHVHSNPMYVTCSKQSFCVSAERINYTPISFDSIREHMLNGTN